MTAEHEHAQFMPTPSIWGREERYRMALTIYSNYCFSLIIKAKQRTWESSQVRAERRASTKGIPLRFYFQI